MGKLPAFQFYPGDWHKDVGVQSLDFFTRHVWFEMLLLMHDSEERGVLILNGKPMTTSALAQALNLDNQNLESRLTTILDYGVASRRESDGAIYCRRMVRDESLRKIRRECGSKGGNPNLVNQKPTTRVKQKPTPSSSSSSSSSDIIVIPKSLDIGPFRKAWDELIAYRKERKQKFVHTSQVRLLARFEKWGVDRAVAAIEYSIANGWAGVFEPTDGAHGRGGPPRGLPENSTHARYGTIRRCLGCDQGPIDKTEVKCAKCRADEAAILARRQAK